MLYCILSSQTLYTYGDGLIVIYCITLPYSTLDSLVSHSVANQGYRNPDDQRCANHVYVCMHMYISIPLPLCLNKMLEMIHLCVQLHTYNMALFIAHCYVV